VRLESLCRISMRYVGASWHRPYGPRGEDEEALGFGHGVGAVSGEIEGELVWANYPAVAKTACGHRTCAA
jgi:hypothetical protein